MNKTFVPIANKFTKERKNGVYESNDKCCFDSVSNYFAFREISEGEIENYIKNIKANKSVSCDVPSIWIYKTQCKSHCSVFLTFVR